MLFPEKKTAWGRNAKPERWSESKKKNVKTGKKKRMKVMPDQNKSERFGES